MSQPRTHQERAEDALGALLGVRDGRKRRENVAIIARSTFPVELIAVLRRYVTFHQGHVLPPELSAVQNDARSALALYPEKEAPE